MKTTNMTVAHLSNGRLFGIFHNNFTGSKYRINGPNSSAADCARNLAHNGIGNTCINKEL
jgi:hypothetical protein